jgi:FlaA1/EpsC-like NDP-sugar epimerase
MAASPLTRFAAPLYLTAALFVTMPIVDAITNVYPFNLGASTWRYGAIGAAANYLISVVFGALLLVLTAAHNQHTRTMRAGAIGSLVGAVLLVLMAGEFALDVLQLRSVVPPEDMRAYVVGATKAELKFLLSAAALAAIGLVAWKAGRRSGSGRRDTPTPLVGS